LQSGGQTYADPAIFSAQQLNTQNKTIITQLSHFSTYGLLCLISSNPAPVAPAPPAAAAAPANEQPSGLSLSILIVVALGGLALIVFVIKFIFRQTQYESTVPARRPGRPHRRPPA
jgi:hypothetical protein